MRVKEIGSGSPRASAYHINLDRGVGRTGQQALNLQHGKFTGGVSFHTIDQVAGPYAGFLRRAARQHGDHGDVAASFGEVNADTGRAWVRMLLVGFILGGREVRAVRVQGLEKAANRAVRHLFEVGLGHVIQVNAVQDFAVHTQIAIGLLRVRFTLAKQSSQKDLSAIQSIFNGTDASIAPREKAEALTGCVIGAIPPFSFNDPLIVLADPLIQENGEVVFNAGRLDRSIFMRSVDYFRIAKPKLLNIALRT